MAQGGRVHRATEELTILVVDADSNSLSLMTSVLTDIGVRGVVNVPSVDRALEVLSTGRVDCIVMDWMEEGGQGLHLVRWVRMSPDSPASELPIVLCTAARSVQQIVDARDAGVSEVVAKPFSHSEVEKKLNAATHRRRPFVRSIDFAGPDRRRREANWPKGDRRNKKQFELSQAEIDTLMRGVD